jgi:hypothetical protein
MGVGVHDASTRALSRGAVLPDLIDKPLVAAGVVPVSHSVGHSVVVVGLGAGLVLAWPRLRDAAPLVVGWVGHIGADLVVAVGAGSGLLAGPLVAVFDASGGLTTTALVTLPLGLVPFFLVPISTLLHVYSIRALLAARDEPVDAPSTTV